MSKTIHQALSDLKSHRDSGSAVTLRAAFAADSGRAGRYTVGLDDLRMDFSKCAVNDETLALLSGLASAAGVEAQRDRMFAGEAINTTEGRAVLHTALRAATDADIRVGGENVVPQVHAVLDAMGAFSDGVPGDGDAGAGALP